ncbi:hypothetical protein A1395_08120 [Pseudomonas protegens]|nr:hypothetical protein A1395_08120 [Pseudomonas protegens]
MERKGSMFEIHWPLLQKFCVHQVAVRQPWISTDQHSLAPGSWGQCFSDSLGALLDVLEKRDYVPAIDRIAPLFQEHLEITQAQGPAPSARRPGH